MVRPKLWLPLGIALDKLERDAYTHSITGRHKEAVMRDMLTLNTMLTVLSKGGDIS